MLFSPSELGDKPWDLAPIKLLVEEAGGSVTTLNGSSRRYDEIGPTVVASNGIDHLEIINYFNKLNV